jgi:hypothetical protein
MKRAIAKFQTARVIVVAIAAPVRPNLATRTIPTTMLMAALETSKGRPVAHIFCVAPRACNVGNKPARIAMIGRPTFVFNSRAGKKIAKHPLFAAADFGPRMGFFANESFYARYLGMICLNDDVRWLR